MADAPRAYFRFREASGDPGDSSGFGNNIRTVAGTPQYRQPSPITGDPTDTSILLDNDPTTLSADDANSLDLGDVMSVEAWVKRQRTSGALEECICVKYNAYGMFFNNDRLALIRSNVA